MPSRRELANCIRALAMDAVERAGSGHPGMPMGMADIAEVLWNDYLKHNPANPKWPDRDRFLLSNGHGCMLQYAALHLSGYDLPMDEIKRLRQLHSKTPGHPEYGITPGVEVTTGPLGQGLGNSVGFALAERLLATHFNRPGFNIVDHYTYVFCGDGCLMEEISHGAGSFAGTLGLGKLIAFYDDNGISIDGEVKGWFTDDVPARFEAYGWHAVRNVDGMDGEAVKKAIDEARAVTDKPSIICCKTIIGYGAPTKQGTSKCHGSALGAEEIAGARKALGWKYPPFEIPQEYYAAWDAKARGKAREDNWNKLFAEYRKAYPELAAEFERRVAGRLPEDWAKKAEAVVAGVAAHGTDIASRKASQQALNGFGPLLPGLVGGSADLTESNDTFWKGSRALTPGSFDGNYLHFGVREFTMTTIVNAMALHGGLIPYGGTFLTFSDYARNAVRLACFMGAGSILVYTHDSIGLGGDGPTHQPIEHLASLRLMPGMELWRPCDDVETAVCWQAAIERRHGPTALVLSRQSLPHQARTTAQVRDIRRGAYILMDTEGDPDAIVIATGSEVGLAVDAAKELAKQKLKLRVVSMPCTSVFDAEDKDWHEYVLPKKIKARVAVEAGVTGFWWKYVGDAGQIIGIDHYGESAPGDEVMKDFGFTVEHVIKAVKAAVG